jgi:predicted RecB family nuclease
MQHTIPIDFVTVRQALERNELDFDFFKKYPHVDLGTCLSRTFIFPNQTYAVKELGAFLGYNFKHADLGGLYVALNYMAYADNGEELDPRILEYNEDDVRVIPYLSEKALSLSDNVKKIIE